MTLHEHPNAPSQSTVASIGIGVPLATLVAWVCSEFFSVSMPGEVQAALGALVSSGVGWFFVGGRRADTQ